MSEFARDPYRDEALPVNAPEYNISESFCQECDENRDET